ncbi:VOC family protein [Enterococcus rivorum]|uniref:PhnB-like domain-containing protein n=1 Tax=Enterococcus rivorum TaxID=762845 RepID=A0A1E5KTK3_9ENTE|nr:VOC family protein [Enterococcus rivorum]MBP2097961.1 putative 3-demethylubiquinone-9 3-methyltransferase (glyoxalase superfamily) [Enterococcus rivorum]OEH81186.1 hypothetical protein BCR26_04890 [Enterococcus rivorum]
MKMTTFLTLPATSEKAMKFYETSFPKAQIKRITRYTENVPNASKEMIGKVLNGELEIQGQTIYFMDMMPEQAPQLSWAISIYTECATENELDTIFANLAKEGTVMMGPEPIMNLRKVAWVTDKFNVTWQLVWA